PTQQERTTISLAPARVLEGVIRAADTGKPLPDAHLRVDAWDKRTTRPARQGETWGRYLPGRADARADAQGRYRVNPFPGDTLDVWVYPPDGAPYLVVNKRGVTWPEKAARHELDLTLPRGVLVRGKVTEAGSGKPVPGAAVQFQKRMTNNPQLARAQADPMAVWWVDDALSGPDGGFQIAVQPGPGHLLVRGPTDDYVHVETSTMQLETGQRGGRPLFPDGLLPLELHPATEAVTVSITLRRGVTVRGRV